MTGKKKIICLLFICTLLSGAYAQEEDSAAPVYHFNGSLSVTNNGFSFIPSFSLGKPAAVADLSVGGERFSFDPQFRFDLNGLKPWSFIFIWRYKAVQTERFQMKVGVHLPAISFREQTFVNNGETRVKLIPNRFITPELMPTYTFSKQISLGMYYIYGLGLEKEDQTRQTHFISLRAYFSLIPLPGHFSLSWNPQLYYLNLDGTDGFYAAHSLALGHEKIPLSLTTMMNFKLRSDIETKDFDWNISLVYSFNNRFVKK